MQKSYHFLIAEDDPVLRDLYVRKFSRTEFSVSTAANGQEALQMIERDPPDLVILDLNMPVMDGFSVLEKLPKSRRTFPVIIITNFDDEQSRTRAESLSIDGYFVKKDMTIQSLVDMVDSLLKSHKTVKRDSNSQAHSE